MVQKDPKFSFGGVNEEFSDATQRNLPQLELAPDLLPGDQTGGYNPYERDLGSRRSTAAPQRTDLRKLSEWIKLRQQVEAEKAAPPVDPDKPKG